MQEATQQGEERNAEIEGTLVFFPGHQDIVFFFFEI